MNEKQKKILIDALPMLAKLSGGYATLTDSEGVMLVTYNHLGEEIFGYKGQVYETAARCSREHKPSIGPAYYDQNCMAWAVPIDDLVLVSTDTQRTRNEENIKAAMKKSLPSIAKIVGGHATICDKDGLHIASCNSHGEPIELSECSEDGKIALDTMEPITAMSQEVEGADVVYIPITRDCCLILNNITISQKDTKLIKEIKKLQHTRYNVDDIIGNSEQMQQAKVEVKRVAQSNSTVLLSGETGTGKEMFAQAIHNSSSRAGKPFIAINCGALPTSLIESSLFGYEEGAFTGAKKGGMPGSFEQANDGTIFLDEISEIDFSLQSTLLRVLQEKYVTRIGSSTPIHINARVISATNKNLRELVKEKKFREDLYYRLDVIHLTIPTLRERIGDLEPLTKYFVTQFNTHLGKVIKRINRDTLRVLGVYSWPGNVRELENTIEYAMNIVDYTENELMPFHLPRHIMLNASMDIMTAEIIEKGKLCTLEEQVSKYEHKIIKYTLENVKYKTTVAAECLGLSLTTLWRKMKKYDLL